MAQPANLYPGLNDISDVLEELPLEVSRYMTLLYEIDAKCVNIIPELNRCIDGFFEGSGVPDESKVPLRVLNQWFQELIPSLEEKMHVSSIACDSLERLTDRLELAYEVALSNQEIPEKLRLGNNSHPAMHLHREIMAKVDSNAVTKSQQALKSESRREAMAAKKTPSSAVAASNGAGVAASTAGTSGAAGAVSPAGASASGKTGSSTAGDGPGPAVQVSAAAVAKTGGNPGHHDHKHHAHSHSQPHTHPHVHTHAHGHGHLHSHLEEQPAAKKRKGNGTSASTGTAANGTSAVQRRGKKRAATTATVSKYQNRRKFNEYGEALYCYCNQVAYGEMVGCDGENCPLEWFHLPCIGLETLPKGKWYCDECLKKL